MKYIKTYEMLQNEPQIGDYVICEESNIVSKIESPESVVFISENIGKIITRSLRNSEIFLIKYKNVSSEISKYFEFDDIYKYYYNVRAMYEREILHCAKDPKDLEIYLSANKYNL